MNDHCNKEENKSNVTNLLLYRQYNTYQVLLEAHNQNELSVDDCFSKIILYIMKWFKARIGENNLNEISEINFLIGEYPEPSEFSSFDISKVKDITSLSVLDVKTAYIKKNNGWVFKLIESDNGNENNDIRGRVFTTNICVYKKNENIVIGVKISCKEPSINQKDADVYRPGFIKSINNDTDIDLSEAGVPYEYRFREQPIFVNGKSSQECLSIFNGLIANPCRQLPILFIPGDYYLDDSNSEEKMQIDKKARSYLGFCHVVVWTKNNQKLFGQAMNNQELLDVSSEGQFIIYRSNPGLEIAVEPTYFEHEDEDKYHEIDEMIKKSDPLRRNYDFREYSLVADKWDPEIVLQLFANNEVDNSDEVNMLIGELDSIRAELESSRRDNEELQRRNREYDSTNRQLEKQRNESIAGINKISKEADTNKRIIEKLKSEKRALESRNYTLETMVAGASKLAKEEYFPLLHFPKFEFSAKKEILDWIETYYSETIIVHERAKKSFYKDNRNLNWRVFCMMIHYLSGYTDRRNNGGMVIDNNSSRDHDPEEYGFTCSPVSSGSNGSKDIYADSYTINVNSFDLQEEDVVMDLHMSQGKGRGVDMIRIYFWYDARIKKSIIGYMPDHLPTRHDPH